jgi:hypothetical protein
VETTTPQSTIEFEEILNHHTHSRAGPPIISQDNNINSPIAYNMRQQQTTCTLTQDVALQISKVKLNMKKVSGRQYPLKFLCDWASAVLDDETGDLLEYHHLLKHPKCKDV